MLVKQDKKLITYHLFYLLLARKKWMITRKDWTKLSKKLQTRQPNLAKSPGMQYNGGTRKSKK